MRWNNRRMPLPRVGSLEVAENPRLQQRGWRIQRFGWVCMALLIAAAAAGLFGSGGPLARDTATTAGLTVEFPRFTRRQTPETVRVQFGADAVRKGEVALWLERAYVEKVMLEEVTPQPLRVVASNDRLIYVFAADGAGSASFHVRFEGAGLLAGRVGLGATALALRHVVYP